MERKCPLMALKCPFKHLLLKIPKIRKSKTFEKKTSNMFSKWNPQGFLKKPIFQDGSYVLEVKVPLYYVLEVILVLHMNNKHPFCIYNFYHS